MLKGKDFQEAFTKNQNKNLLFFFDDIDLIHLSSNGEHEKQM